MASLDDEIEVEAARLKAEHRRKRLRTVGYVAASLGVVAVVALVARSTGGDKTVGESQRAAPTAPPRPPEPPRPALTVDVPTMAHDCESNSVKAEMTYEGKVITVVGPVHGFMSGAGHVGVILAAPGAYELEVECEMPVTDGNKAAVAALNDGDFVEATGFCESQNNGTACKEKLSDCTLKRQTGTP